MLKAAVVILNWNTKDLLEQFLPIVLRNTVVEGVRIYVADNGSTDDSVGLVQRNFGDKIGLISLDKNYGFAEGYNRALKLIEAEYFVLLNTDVEPSPDWLLPLIKTMESDNLIAACMPKIKSFKERDFFEYAGAAGGFIDKYGYPFCQGRVFNSVEMDYGQYEKSREIFWATGACMMVRGPLFKILGGLDSYFFAHMEEIDLCWRLKNRGYRVLYNAESLVYHVGGGTLPKDNPRKTYLNFRNNLLLLYKNLPDGYKGSVLIQRLFLDFIASLHFILKGSFYDFIAVIKAHTSFYRNFRKYKKFRLEEKRFITKTQHKEIYPGSIVVEYYIRKKFTFKAMKWMP